MTSIPCNGLCCAVFTLPKDAVEQLKRGANGKRDSKFILEMIIPLTRRQAVARMRKLGATLSYRRSRHRAYFTCRHFDMNTRLCTVYAKRPGMCRDYPNHGVCDHADCSCLTTAQHAATIVAP